MASLKISILGSGPVGDALSKGFLSQGYHVMRGSREPAKLSAWKTQAGAKAFTGNFAEAAAFGEVVVLAIKGTAAEELVKSLPPETIKGKTVIDVTNPIADLPPTNGVLQYFTGPNESNMERLQKAAPTANFVKAFSCVGNQFMVNPKFAGGPPSMFICGNNDSAKATVSEILLQFGWEIEDMGKVEAARAIEPLCMLWCIPGLLGNRWTHAFKLLKD